MSVGKTKRTRSLRHLVIAGALGAAILVGSFLPRPAPAPPEKPAAQPLVTTSKPSPAPAATSDSVPTPAGQITGPILQDAAERQQRDLLIETYHEWARRQPEPAFLAASQLQDPAAREIAIHSTFSGWARTDPEGLAKFALARPDGPEKTAALTKAMRAWLHQDPWKAGDWIAANESTIAIAEKMFRDDRR